MDKYMAKEVDGKIELIRSANVDREEWELHRKNDDEVLRDYANRLQDRCLEEIRHLRWGLVAAWVVVTPLAAALLISWFLK